MELPVLKESEFMSLRNSPRWLNMEDLEGEIWVKFPAIFDGCEFCDGYMISNYGRLKAKENANRNAFYKGKSHICRTGVNRCGYECVRITFRGVSKTFTIHKIVANAFIPNSYGLKEINHINENKLDNRISNIEWCSRSYNMKYGNGVKEGKKKMLKSPFFVSLMKPVIKCDMNGNALKTFPSISAASKSLGKKTTSEIRKCCNNKQNYAYGYKWKFAQDS